MTFSEAEQIKHQDASRLQAMEEYCMTTSCLRNYILEYFGEKQRHPAGTVETARKNFWK